MDGRTAFGRRLAALSGLLAGTVAGAATFVVAGSAVVMRGADSTSAVVEVTHVPPLLTTAEEQVELRYDAYCVDAEAEEADAPCELEGTVFIRPGADGPFRELPLARYDIAQQLVVRVPDAIQSYRKGFTYYAAIAAPGRAAVTHPAGGSSAPHQSLPLGSPLEIDLGRHVFRRTSHADERIAEASWGDGQDDAGLEQSRNLTPIGASAFDVDSSGTVVLLDQAHRRLLRWRNGSRSPTMVPLAVAGTLADVTLAPDGTLYVLESVSSPGRTPLVRRFDQYGRESESVETAERGPAQIRLGPAGPVVLQHPSGQWMPIAAAGKAVAPESQLRGGSSGRPLRGGGELIVLRLDNEIRVALVGTAGVRRSWRVTSDTALAEVQLAETLGRYVIVVARVYTDDADEFVALVLGAEGLIRRISLDAADWAETAPLGRFRLVGSSLYQLGSTSGGAFVDRFDLEVR